ncbi:MAG: hypothetical protein ACRC8S_01525 [Fimbriiglobus sp.]
MLSEVLVQARALPRQDQLQLIQELAAGLISDDTSSLRPFQDYTIWSPHDANDAADILLSHLLQTGQHHESTSSEIPLPVTG